MSDYVLYHFGRWQVRVIDNGANLRGLGIYWADLLKKVLFGKKRRELFQGVLFDIYDYY